MAGVNLPNEEEGRVLWEEEELELREAQSLVFNVHWIQNYLGDMPLGLWVGNLSRDVYLGRKTPF